MKQKILEKLSREPKLPEGEKLDKLIQSIAKDFGLKLDRRTSKCSDFILEIKKELYRQRKGGKRYRLKYWDDKWQLYSYSTTWLDKSYNVGDTFWIGEKRCEVLEVLD